MYDSVLNISTNADGYELKEHGKFFYPVACYYNDMSEATVIFHWHEEFELIFVVEGAVTVGAGTVEKILREGDGFFINSNVLHNVKQIDSRAGVINSIVFHPNLIGAARTIYRTKYINPVTENKNLQFIYFDGSREKDSQIVSMMRQAWQAQAEENFGFEIEVRNFLSKIILMVSEGSAGKIYSPTRQELRDAERLKPMINFIERHFTDELTVEEIAEKAAVSVTECQKCFKRGTGISPIQFLKEYRILTAAEKIRTSRLKISTIAETCGFFDMSYFAKSFREVFKISPSDYRKKFV